MNRRAEPAHRVVLLAQLVIGLLALGACADGSAGDGGTDELEGVNWVLVRSSIDELVADAPLEARVDLRFQGGEIGGHAGCNIYGGPYELEGPAISLRALSMTEMACEPPLMELEAAYTTALGGVREHRVNGDELLLTGGGVRLVFAPEAEPGPASLLGTTWRLEAVGVGGDAVASPLVGTDVSVVFGDGAATGSGGCNRFRADYELQGDAITFGPVSGTKMACELDVSGQEAAVFVGFARASTLAIEAAVLTFSDAERRFLLSFRAAG